MPLSKRTVTPLLRRALREDEAFDDLTSRTVLPATCRIRARIVAKASGVLAGGTVARWTFQAVDPSLRCVLRRRDGSRLQRGDAILTIEGRARSIFAAERTALNLLGHLCGIATLTCAFVERARGTRAVIYDTRKTLPGLRLLEKYAVRMGGGRNHRMDLSDAVLIKTNHLRALEQGKRGPQSTVHSPQLIEQAITKAKQIRPKRFVEIEVANLAEFHAALNAKPDAILLDNWSLSNIRKAVRLRNRPPSTVHRPPLLEVSGGVTLENVRAIAKTGVDRISIGRLTHSAPSLDVSLQVV